jgi:hypothetical protein
MLAVGGWFAKEQILHQSAFAGGAAKTQMDLLFPA